MKKIVINNCYGGFSLSHEAVVEFYKRKGKEVYAYRFEYTPEGRKYTLLSPNRAKKEILVHYTTEKLDAEINPSNVDEGYISSRDMERNDPDLVAVVEKMGKKANGSYAELKIVEIPADVEWELGEYDGAEHICEKHRKWY